MKPVFTAAKNNPKRVVFCEGEDDRVLRAVQIVIDEGLASAHADWPPGRRGDPNPAPGIAYPAWSRFRAGQSRIRPALPRLLEHLSQAHRAQGGFAGYAKIEMRRRHTLIGAMLIHKGEADSMLCGTFGTHALHLQYIDQVIGLRPGVKHYAAMNALMLPNHTVFICDTYVTPDPDPEHIAEMAILAAEEARRFGMVPKVALLDMPSISGLGGHPLVQKDAAGAGHPHRARARAGG